MSGELDYVVIISTHGRTRELTQTLNSLLSQTRLPEAIVILDDSPISSPVNLNDKVHYLRDPKPHYDSRRIVNNWNRLLDYVLNQRWTPSLMMISGDDCIYPPHYAERVACLFESDSSLAVASGVRGSVAAPPDGFKIPEGSGRFIRSEFLRKLGWHFPEVYGYESWIVYEAIRGDRKVAVLNNLQYEHLGRLGYSHRFVEWGPMMRCLGYHPLFALARTFYGFWKDGEVSRMAWVKILTDYLLSPLTKRGDPYYKLHDAQFRKFVRSFQLSRLHSLSRALKRLFLPT